MPGDPKLHLFGKLKRITRQWLDACLVCKGGTYPAQLMYRASRRYGLRTGSQPPSRARMREGNSPIQVLLDPYNPVGSTRFVNFRTSKTLRWRTDPRKCPINWVILDSDWEAEFCRVAEEHPRVRAYVKNHSLGLTVPYKHGPVNRSYIPDFIVQVDDGRGDDDLLNLVVEIKGYRGEDAKEKKETMETYWVQGRKQRRRVRPLGVRGVHRCVRDRGGVRSQSGGGMQQDSCEECGPVMLRGG